MSHEYKIRCHRCGKMNTLNFDPSKTSSKLSPAGFTVGKVAIGYEMLKSHLCSFCNLPVIDPVSMKESNEWEEPNESVLNAYARLVQAVISSCFRLPHFTMSEQEIVLWHKKNRAFAILSPLISHYAEAFGYDEERIRKRIIEYNE